MCDTNLKFGPEWLRALTEPPVKNLEEKITFSAGLANMKLADHRYGKEEMLALFSPDLQPPKDIMTLGALYVDNCQFPLNLIQMGAEETKAWQKNNEPSAGGRGYSAGGGGAANRSLATATRGRGRGRPANFPYFDRNRFDDPDSDNSNGQPNSAGKIKGDKGWFDSKGKSNPESAGVAAGDMKDWRDRNNALNEKSWKSKQGGLVNGHANSNMNWRSHERNGNVEEPSSKAWTTVGMSGPNSAFRRDKGNLPEWVTANSNNIAEGGFDDNGKFRPDDFSSVDNLPKWTDDDKWIEEEVEPEIIQQQQQQQQQQRISPPKPTQQQGQENGLAVKNKSPGLENVGKPAVAQPGTTEPAVMPAAVPPGATAPAPGSSPPVLPSGVRGAASSDATGPTSSLTAGADLGGRPGGGGAAVPTASEAAMLTSNVGVPPSSVMSSGVSVGGGGVQVDTLSLASTNNTQPSSSAITGAPPGHQLPSQSDASQDDIKWSYLDPQGQVQGPFRNDEMLEWSSAGYFPNDLLIKRNMDGRFIPLSDMLRLYGKNPFTAGPIPRAISNVDVNEHINQQQYLHHLLMQHQQQQQMLVQQQQLMMLHHQNTNLNNMFFNKPVNQTVMKPSDNLMPDIIERKQQEEVINNLQQQQQQQQKQRSSAFDLASDTTASPSYDAIKSLLSQLKETNTFPGKPEDKDNSGAVPGGGNPPQVPHSTAPHHHQPMGLHVPMPGGGGQQHMQASLHHQKMSVNIEQEIAQLVGVGTKPSVMTSGVQNTTNLGFISDMSPSPLSSSNSNNNKQPQFSQSLSIQEETRFTKTQDLGVSDALNQQFQSLSHDPKTGQQVMKEEERVKAEIIQIKSSAKFDRKESKEAIVVQQPDDIESENVDDNEFKVPRINEKKEKKTRKAEIKKKAKAKETKPSAPYIPGLPGSQQPQTPPAGSNPASEDDRASQEREPDNKKRNSESSQSTLEPLLEVKESQTKPAPWANCKSPENRELSLHDIQKLEAEKERKRRAERTVLESEIRAAEKREQELRKTEKQATWSQQPFHSNNVKSLAEIQAEEEKNIIRQHEQQKETKSRKAQQQQHHHHQQQHQHHNHHRMAVQEKQTSWAGKIAASIPVVHSSPAAIQSKTRVAAPAATDGFWEQPAAVAAAQPQPSNKNSKQDKKQNKHDNKKDNKNDMGKSFKEWCRAALENLNPGPEVDIETFLGFLQDIESPYEVNDYIKSYIGEGKAHKKFAADYLDKRSQLKNALKKGGPTEDDLTSPAVALAHDVEFQEAPRKNKKKTRNSKTNLNHLLGFTSAPGHSINRGELDLSM